MNYEELYEKAHSGDLSALKELESEAGSGNAEAQYVLSCVYDNVTSPFRNVELGMYWLKKSSDYGYELAVKKIRELPLEIKYKYDIANKEEEEIKYQDAEYIKPGGIWSIQGRIDRTTYWVYSILYVIVFAILIYLIALLPKETMHSGFYYSEQPSDFAYYTLLIVRLVAVYLTFVLQSKRAHDCGHPCLMVLIPFFGIYLLFKEGEPHTNQYGPQPK